MEYPTFRVEMGRLALVYGEQPPERLLEYWEALRGLRDLPFQRACAAYKQTPGAIRFPFPNELIALVAAAAPAPGAPHARALGAGAHDAAKRFAQADAARRDLTNPPDPVLLAHWDAKFADLLARRDAKERAARGEPPLPTPPPPPAAAGDPAPLPLAPPPIPAFARPARPVRPVRPTRPRPADPLADGRNAEGAENAENAAESKRIPCNRFLSAPSASSAFPPPASPAPDPAAAHDPRTHIRHEDAAHDPRTHVRHEDAAHDPRTHVRHEDAARAARADARAAAALTVIFAAPPRADLATILTAAAAATAVAAATAAANAGAAHGETDDTGGAK